VQISAPKQAARAAKIGEAVYEGDTLKTAVGSEAHVTMADGGFMALRPDSQLLIAKYQANGDTNDVSAVQLVQGALRSITGWIGKSNPRSYTVRTATATIGVRGTEHETVVVTSGDAAAQGTYDRVYEGATTLNSPAGAVPVQRNSAGFAPADASRGKPRVLKELPLQLFRAGRRDAQFIGLHKRIHTRVFQLREERRARLRQERGIKGPPPGPKQFLEKRAGPPGQAQADDAAERSERRRIREEKRALRAREENGESRP
jgi:hypothetical protein